MNKQLKTKTKIAKILDYFGKKIRKKLFSQWGIGYGSTLYELNEGFTSKVTFLKWTKIAKFLGNFCKNVDCNDTSNEPRLVALMLGFKYQLSLHKKWLFNLNKTKNNDGRSRLRTEISLFRTIL